METSTDQLNGTTNSLSQTSVNPSSESPSSDCNVNDVNKKVRKYFLFIKEILIVFISVFIYLLKVKLEHKHNNNNNSIGSRVVHIRNVPIDSTETDLMHVSIPFGRVTNILLLKGKSQAFVEFEFPAAAQQMVSYWIQSTMNGMPTALQPTVRGRHVVCQLSNHKELKLNSNNTNANNQMNDSINNHLNSLQQNQLNVDGQSNGQSCVLRVVIENMIYAVSLEVIHSVFSRYNH